MCCSYAATYPVRAKQLSQRIAYLRNREIELSKEAEKLNQDTLSNKSASLQIGDLGTYVIIRTWNNQGRQGNIQGLGDGFSMSGINIDPILRMIINADAAGR